MRKIADIIRTMECYAPKELAEAWDHVGLMVGDPQQTVTKVLLALDVTQEIAEEAVSMGCQMIISHHPFLFHSLQSVDLSTAKGRTVAYLLQYGITVYSAHTNLDYAPEGVNATLHRVAEEATEDGDVSVQKFAHNIKKALQAPVVRVYGASERLQKPVGKFVVGCGAFDGDIPKLLEQQAEVLVTGEIKYNTAVDLMECGICVIEAGHYDTEHIVLPRLQNYLKTQHTDVDFYLTSKGFKVSIIP